MRHTGFVSSFLGNSYINLFPYKETHFFDFIQFPSFIAQLCNLVAHPVGTGTTFEEAVENGNRAIAQALMAAKKSPASQADTQTQGQECGLACAHEKKGINLYSSVPQRSH